jgi:AdoMet-dependent rRNA methyltransferase SPB1
MGKAQKKTGKGRLDKYYKLAKEQGYRARSAFKLIQLNKKYSFLESARCCIDLCAAPGGWLQVASKYMPPNSVIVGVDLVPIKPIPRVTTFAADITTQHCRNLLRSEVKDWKADVVLHDGAPNVGTAWIQDAYSQSELVLMSLKLAVEFLIKGGTFVTKVFRSVDYNNLIWVFTQLFGKVEATKPPSSRNVSAEIFVVCRDFLAPKYIDPKFLDPRHVFKDLAASVNDKGTSANNVQANVFHPEKKRRKRDGYDDGDYTLFKKLTATEFIRGTDPIAMLGSVNQISFETEEEKEWLTSGLTTPDVKANCDDLKVLGKGDFKSLLKWRLLLREDMGLDVNTKNTEDITEQIEVIEVIDEEEELSNELERLNTEAAARSKRERRKANESKARAIQRMQLKMMAPTEIGLEQTDASLAGQEDFFNLEQAEKKLRKRGGLANLVNADTVAEFTDEEIVSAQEDQDILDEDEERERKTRALEAELDGLYTEYQDHLRDRDAKYKVRESRSKNKEREAWGGISRSKRDSDDSESEEEDEEGGWDKMQDSKYQVDDDSSSSSSEESDDDRPARKRRRGESGKALVTQLSEPKPESSQAAKLWFSQGVFAGVEDGLGDDEDGDDNFISEVDDEEEGEEEEGLIEPDEETDSEAAQEDFGVVPQDDDMWDVADEDQGETNRQYIASKSTVS